MNRHAPARQVPFAPTADVPHDTAQEAIESRARRGVEFPQSAAASTWTINHNFGFKPTVAVFSVGGVEVVADVQHITSNQVQINFSTPTAGFARLI